MADFTWKYNFEPQNKQAEIDIPDDLFDDIPKDPEEGNLRGTESATKKWISQDNSAMVYKWFMVHGRYVNGYKVDRFAVNVKIRYDRNKSVIIDKIHKLLVSNGYKHPVIDTIYMKVL